MKSQVNIYIHIHVMAYAIPPRRLQVIISGYSLFYSMRYFSHKMFTRTIVSFVLANKF